MIKKAYKPLVPNGERADRAKDPKEMKRGAAISMSQVNYDWLLQEAATKGVTFSRYVNEAMTELRLRVQKERESYAMVTDYRTPN